jgi:hypothetical protein
MRPGVWGEVIRPMLADRQGWATFIGTPKGRNEFHAIYERATRDTTWFVAMLKASETGLLPASELDLAKAEMTPEQYAQEFECSFDAAIIGSYYGSYIADAERDGRIGDYPADPALPVHTSWDLGIGDSTAILLWQAAPDGIRIIDHIESSGKGLPFYVAALEAKPYKYGDDWVPPDAKARELGTGRTRVETLLSLGRRPRVVPSVGIEDGINAVRQVFQRIRLHEPTTRDAVEAWRQYRADYDEKTKVFTNKPRHDWTSHTADALRYLALAYREIAEKPKPVKRIIPPGYVELPGAPQPERRIRIKI